MSMELMYRRKDKLIKHLCLDHLKTHDHCFKWQGCYLRFQTFEELTEYLSEGHIGDSIYVIEKSVIKDIHLHNVKSLLKCPKPVYNKAFWFLDAYHTFTSVYKEEYYLNF
ncbi:hypothetical protein Glove_90g34 [Diversispora epigaea]|uniref:Uncharacterized protein n=1 Tax=Diversispora epigaea TaxID=1348612 RepID=A0A397J685_9GLOM|nr:hypothetical protein Glove_90g34 [Diversispora epigaea]